MQFTPKTKKELEEAALIPKGYYPIEIYEAEETDSSNGNPMLVLQMKVYVGEGQRFLKDYIVLNNDLGLAKLFSLCDAAGLMAEYNAGDVGPDDIRGKECYAYIIQQPDKTTKEPRNNLRSYMTEAEAQAKHEKEIAKSGGLASGVARAKKIIQKAAPSDSAPDDGDDLPEGF